MVIGGGPAGYTAAVRAAQLGATVVLIEKTRLGGACLNQACVPTKFLRYAGSILRGIEKAGRYGIAAEVKRVDWSAMQARRQALIDDQAEGLRGLLDDYGIKVVYGEARLLKERMSSVTVAARETRYRADKVILATGSVPLRPNIPGVKYALSSSELLQIKDLPHRLAIVGAGPVGVELATIFARLGTAVSLIEMLPRILPGEDAELAGMLERELKKASVSLYTAKQVRSIEKTKDRYRVVLAGDNAEVLEVDSLAMCIGQKPHLDNLRAVGLKTNHGAITVNRHLGTGVEGVYAAGDVTGKGMLAYVAMMQGRIAAENALGYGSLMKYEAIPRCVFSMPELASVGLTEEAAAAKGLRTKTGRSPFSANVAATISNERRGLVKIVAEAASDRLLGVHILGPEAPLLIHEAALALKMRAAVSDLQSTFHIHPSLAETLWEAAFDANGNQ